MPSSARRLVEPDIWVCPHGVRQRPQEVMTFGPEVADLNARAGFAPDPQQELGLDLVFAFQQDGSPVTFQFCIVCARQNLKTGFLKQCVVGWLYVVEVPVVAWSAHEMKTTRASQRDLERLLTGSPALSKRLKPGANNGIYYQNGEERIELRDQQVTFNARTRDGGRGLSVPKLILDEAFALRAAMMGALVPLILAMKDPQILLASSAGKADSEVLHEARERAEAEAFGTGEAPDDDLEPEENDFSYIEWRADREACEDPDCNHKPREAKGCALDREHLMLQANPSVSTGRITIPKLRKARRTMPPAEFMRECLTWWDYPEEAAKASAIFGPDRWEACAVDLDGLLAGGDVDLEPVAFAVAVSVDRTAASIASAAMVESADPADPEAEPEDRLFVAATERRDEVAWLIPALQDLQERWPEAVILLDEKGPAKDLMPDLDEADIAYETVTLDEYAEACSRLFDKVRARELMHPDSSELNTAVEGAVWRTVGDRQVWGRRKSANDVSMLEAATLAAHGVEKYGW